ncbi:hypothetical protein BP5796_01192 [Coleophoma crateriformis]|uniref:Uncharacterized protein n=1 Tax=Coleophoma crateriformis TaxID=565419 RepID=A0A3D8T1B4_9HELO|nr:hypothetical protein BP5796_01192 [Coleophoma crateriformis]
MRLKYFLGLIAATLFADLDLVAAAPYSKFQELSERATSIYCDSSNTAALDYAFNEMKQMLTIAITRTAALKPYLFASTPANINEQPSLLH